MRTASRHGAGPPTSVCRASRRWPASRPRRRTAAHAERDLGSIEVGKLADFVVLSRDIMTVVPADVLGAKVRRTFIGGRQVFPLEP